MKKSRKLWPYLLGAFVLLILLLVIGKKAGWIGKEMKLKVSTEKVTSRTLTEVITANGKVEPQTEVKISPEVPGEIIELPVKEGDRVKKGDLLVVIKPDIYISNLNRTEAALNTQRARLAQAEAQLVEKELNYNRAKQLYERNTIPKSEFETVEAAWKVAKSEVQAAQYSIKSSESGVSEAKENLTKTKIYAPIDGTVSKLNVEQGERVVGTNQFAGTELMTIANLNIMEVKVEVNENDIVRVAKNDTALIEIDAYLKKKFKGVVTEIASSANVSGTAVDQVTNFNVKVLLLPESYSELMAADTTRYPFLPGMSATVEIQTKTRRDVVVVPIQAVTTRANDGTAKADNSKLEAEGPSTENQSDKMAQSSAPEQFEIVFRMENGLARQVKVKTGIQDNTHIEILEGVSLDDEIITAPYGLVSKTLKDSTAVEVVKVEDLYKTK